MSTYSAIYTAICTKVATVGSLVPSPISIDLDSLSDSRAPGPSGGWFVVQPQTLDYGGAAADNNDGDAGFVVLFTWAHNPDPSTRIGEALDRAEAIRNVLLDDASLTVDCRLDPQAADFTYTPDLIACSIPVRILSYRST